MWSRDNRAAFARVARLAAALAAAGLLAACFQPLYGDRSVTGSPALRTALQAVDVLQIEAANGTQEARIAVEVRNSLLFELTGGAGSISPTHQLKINISLSKSALIVDVTTGRTEAEVTGIDAIYQLTELATGKVVFRSTTFARVSSDVPGQQQRFARSRAQRDAEDRAAKVIAENIRSRLASHFVAGT